MEEAGCIAVNYDSVRHAKNCNGNEQNCAYRKVEAVLNIHQYNTTDNWHSLTCLLKTEFFFHVVP